MKDLEKLLSGGDLRSIGKSNAIAAGIKDQAEFDELFQYLFYEDRLVKMRAADALEKVSVTNPDYLKGHKKELFKLLNTEAGIELQWHLAQLITQADLTTKETETVWAKLSEWALNKNQSRIVRVNSLQSLFEISNQHSGFESKLKSIFKKLEQENAPSLLARIRKLKKKQPLNSVQTKK